MFDKRYQVQRTFFTVKNFPNSVDAAMPNKIIHQEFIYYLRKLTFEGIYVLNSRKSLFPGVSAYP
jgi:hypothetical protein